MKKGGEATEELVSKEVISMKEEEDKTGMWPPLLRKVKKRRSLHQLVATPISPVRVRVRTKRLEAPNMPHWKLDNQPYNITCIPPPPRTHFPESFHVVGKFLLPYIRLCKGLSLPTTILLRASSHVTRLSSPRPSMESTPPPIPRST